MEHEIKDNTYIIYDLDHKEIFRVELTNTPSNQIIITTPYEVYSGPIDLISFSSEPPVRS